VVISIVGRAIKVAILFIEEYGWVGVLRLGIWCAVGYVGLLLLGGLAVGVYYGIAAASP